MKLSCHRLLQSSSLALCSRTRGRVDTLSSKRGGPYPTATRTVIHSNAFSSPPATPASKREEHNKRTSDTAMASAKGPLTNFGEHFNFPQMEEEVLQMWEDTNAFQSSLKQSEGKKLFSFYDGPPFATGLPHYGHLLAGTMKDMVCRYAHQNGFHVVRRFGWDCHGLPIEFEIDKELGIKSSHDVEKLGISNYNNECRKIVMRYSSEWRKSVERMGRWIDFDNDYKTMDLSYMESIWWVFSQLWEKKLVYRGNKVMPYSTGCTTPLSNFEANMNYKDVSDPSVTVAFQTTVDANLYFLAWTTTPWTLPSNLALCVHSDVDYVKVLDTITGRHYILAEARLPAVYPPKKTDKKSKGEVHHDPTASEAAPYTVLETMKGAALVGMTYIPLFPYFADEKKAVAFRVLSDAYVTTDAGTGVVHQAPGFGEDDYRVCVKNGVIEKDGTPVCPVDENGCFTVEVTDFVGRYVKEVDPDVIKYLEAKGQLVSKATIVHSYPFCWRSETPLLYKAVTSWFVNVESFRDRLLKANDSTHWVPDFVKTRRFSNWLEEARDWNVSRNRYWGTPIPIWHSEDWEEVICVSSVAELEELSGVRNITDIHRHFVDDITIPSKRPGMPPLRRVSVVFDCWFESGSMPYAQVHYPMENKECFSSYFPADFVAEGLDQTRGWFYTLLVLGVALFDKAPFRNIVVNGLVLAEDGKKMSKRLKNYPEPGIIITTYGADAIRMYLINSPVVRGEPLRFREGGVKGIVKDVMLPLMNATKFFITNVNQAIAAGGVVSLNNPSTNEMDRWIASSTQSLIRYVRKEMSLYRLYNVVPGILRFVIDLSNWYVRMNRRRMKCAVSLSDGCLSLSTMLTVLYTVSRVMAHIAPFTAEIIYQRLKPLLPASEQADSVHHLMLPEEDVSIDDPDLERAMLRMINVVELLRVLRDRMVLPMKRPVRQVIIVHPDQVYLDDMEKVLRYIKEEVNAFEISLSRDDEFVTTQLDVNFEVVGKRFRKELPALRKAVQAMTASEIASMLSEKKATVAGHELTIDDVKPIRKIKEGIVGYESQSDNDVVVLIDKSMDDSLIDLWRAREFVHHVQQLRKKASLVVSQNVDVYFECEEEELTTSLLNSTEYVRKTIRGVWKTMDQLPADANILAEEDNVVTGIGIRLVFVVPPQ